MSRPLSCVLVLAATLSAQSTVVTSPPVPPSGDPRPIGTEFVLVDAVGTPWVFGAETSIPGVEWRQPAPGWVDVVFPEVAAIRPDLLTVSAHPEDGGAPVELPTMWHDSAVRLSVDRLLVSDRTTVGERGDDGSLEIIVVWPTAPGLPPGPLPTLILRYLEAKPAAPPAPAPPGVPTKGCIKLVGVAVAGAVQGLAFTKIGKDPNNGAGFKVQADTDIGDTGADVRDTLVPAVGLSEDIGGCTITIKRDPADPAGIKVSGPRDFQCWAWDGNAWALIPLSEDGITYQKTTL